MTESYNRDLREVRALAQKLYRQCRYSPSSFKLLASSIKVLRNLLEDLEDALETCPLFGPDEAQLAGRVTQARDLLGKLDLSVQSYRCSKEQDVSESAVADFKTALDVTGQDLTSALDAISTGEIPLKLDTDVVPGPSSLSTRGASVSMSAVDSAYAHERLHSTRTSSASSLAGRGVADQDTTASLPHVADDNNGEQRPSQEKEVYDLGTAYLHNSASIVETMPSPDWRQPFSSLYPDPMSISIEQASSMILMDDQLLTPSPHRPRSTTSPSGFADTHESNTERLTDEQTTVEPQSIGDSYSTDENHDRAGAVQQDATKLPSLEELILPLRSKSLSSTSAMPLLPTLGVTTSSETTSGLGIHRSSDAANGNGHLSPIVAGRGFDRRYRNKSAPSITFSIGPVESGGRRTGFEADSPIQGLRKELSVVLENAWSDSDELALHVAPPQSSMVESKLRSLSITKEDELLPPPPMRKPPSPPKLTQVPKIPRPPSKYRIANAPQPNESSSDDEDLYSSSKPSTPAFMTPPLNSESFEQNASSVNVSESASREANKPSPYEKHERRLSKDGFTHAQRVLEKRAAYTTPISPISPKSSENDVRTLGPAFSQDLDAAKSKTSTSDQQSASASPSGTPQMQGEASSPSPKRPPPIPERSSKTGNHNISAPKALQPVIAKSQLEPVSGETGLKGMPSDGESVSGSRGENFLTIQPGVTTRSSFDVTLKGQSEAVRLEAPNAVRRTASTSNIPSAEPSITAQPTTGWYAPGRDSTTLTDLDKERIDHIVHFWNSSAWDQAEGYLRGYLESLVDQDDLARARRVRHLLGVCASFKGSWSQAIPYFLSVLRIPISDISAIDDGDSAAAYWLGDTYALLNQRTEALLAYCIAACSSMFQNVTAPDLSDCIEAEQRAVQLGISKADFKVRWAQKAFSPLAPGTGSILDAISTPAAKELLDQKPQKSRGLRTARNFDSGFQLDQNKARSTTLFALHKRVHPSTFHRLRLTPEHFEPDTTWPMMYDPMFAMANVRRGRLLQYECNLVDVFASNSEAKVPKAGPMSLNRLDWSTGNDLNWLILTIRECLRVFEMEWSEVANVEGTWFVVRYSFMHTKIATTNYFSIALFRQPLRSGYAIEICPDGICSARIVRSDWEYQKGVHHSESKRIKNLIREYLESAAKQQPKVKRRQSSMTPAAPSSIRVQKNP